MDKFDLKKFAGNANVTYIELNDNDFLYIQLPPESFGGGEVGNEKRLAARKCLEHYLPNTKILVDDVPLRFTVITKKEEFVARLNDHIVQL